MDRWTVVRSRKEVLDEKTVAEELGLGLLVGHLHRIVRQAGGDVTGSVTKIW